MFTIHLGTATPKPVQILQAHFNFFYALSTLLYHIVFGDLIRLSFTYLVGYELVTNSI